MARILGAVLLIATTVDAFNVGSFVAPRAFLPLAGNAGGVSRRQCRPQTLQMSSSPDQEEKMRRARKLADDAKAAMDSAKAAEAKANMYRGKVVNLDPGSEVRTRQLLGNLGGVFYRQWAGLLTGRGDDVGKDPLGLDDTFYSQGAEARAETIKTVFTQFDTDGNGAIDEYELRAGVKEVFGCDALGDEEVAALMKEADLNKNGVIGRDEFNTMVSLVLDKGEAQVLAATQKAANDARTQTRVDTTAAMVKGALTSARLVGDAKETCRVLDDLKTKGGIKLWDTAGAIFYPTGADRMKEMTGMEDPEQDLGLNVDPWTRFRYQGVGVLGISGGAALIAANFLPAQFQDAAVLYGYGTLFVNVGTTVLSPFLDKIILKNIEDQVENFEDRLLRREAGRFLGAYLCGVPIESIGNSEQGRLEIIAYSRKNGNVNFEELSKPVNIDAEGALLEGLTKKEEDKQSIVQMMGLVAELRKYKKAEFGYRSIAALDFQLQTSQKYMDQREKQGQARYGITQGFSLLEQHAEVFEKLVVAVGRSTPASELIAIIEDSTPAPAK
eukprot:CAMPEP_0180130852 /NCGR_PEP_ID=MMETSP0986-20121125/8095_1 /TAXON_ID=697907 /ORGANISM="non described non described, Strain CCMP2293" /LENGTH=554 /DNA_ID=CAMNT_0022070665 /DNA_START=105 /DNA_END=1769 /DNA_ORIENTATION=-